MQSLASLVTYLDEYLAVADVSDYAPNGLQVEGRSEINSIVTGVTASQALIDAALAKQADAIIVHHGYFWRGEAPVITGIKRKRIQALLNNNVSLLAYHLPLDIHHELGNNTELAKLLGLQIEKRVAVAGVTDLLCYGRVEQEISGAAFAEHLQQALHRQPLYIPGTTGPINTVAWCTGGAQRYIEKAIRLGADAYITGEVSESTVHIAREAGIHFYAAGHHATERYGVKALGEHLAQKFGFSHEFVDIDNPV